MTPKLVVFTDRRTGDTFTMTVPPTSPWHAMLENVTEAEIRRETPAEIAERKAYAEAGGILLTRRPETPRR